MLDWFRKVFDPLTQPRAGNKPRILINDGFVAHESAEVLKFCFENNIILCRLPSHTSHVLQPCHVAVFGPLKTAYREQVGRLLRGGSGTVSKEHFTMLYSRARDAAFISRNIKSGWSKTGLYPLNPDQVLREVKPQADESLPQSGNPKAISPTDEDLQTPVTPKSLTVLGRKIDKDTDVLDNSSKICVKKLIKAAERAIVKGALFRA